MRVLAGHPVTPAEIKALFDACARDRMATGDRDAALLAVLYGGACGAPRPRPSNCPTGWRTRAGSASTSRHQGHCLAEARSWMLCYTEIP